MEKYFNDKISQINDILKSCKDKPALINALLKMVDEVMDIITGEPDEEESKNVSWTVTEMKKPSVEVMNENKTE